MKAKILLLVLILAGLSLAVYQVALRPAPLLSPLIVPVAEFELAEPLQRYPGLEDYVSMTITRLTPRSATIRVYNDSGFFLAMSPSYAMEVYDEGQWWRVPLIESELARAFPSILLGVDPYSSRRFDNDFLSYYQYSGPRLHRIRKEVWIDAELIDGYRSRYFGESFHEIAVEFYWER